MEKNESVLIKVMKALLIMFGALLLIGGGLCAVADTYFLIAFQESIAAILLGVAVLVALAGWGMIKWARGKKEPSAQLTGKTEDE